MKVPPPKPRPKAPDFFTRPTYRPPMPAIPPPPPAPERESYPSIEIDFDPRMPPDPPKFTVEEHPTLREKPIAWDLAKKVFDDLPSEERREEAADHLLAFASLDEDSRRRVVWLANALLFKSR